MQAPAGHGLTACQYAKNYCYGDKPTGDNILAWLWFGVLM